MAYSIAQTGIQVLAPYVRVATQASIESIKNVYEANRHRIYSLAFWMTDNELTAEEVSASVFTRAFTNRVSVTPELLDRYLISELREFSPIGPLTLETQITSTKKVTGNTKRIHLERAVVQIPATERMAFLLHDVEGYDHAKVSKTLGISEDESKQAVFQARILVRELMSQMI